MQLWVWFDRELAVAMSGAGGTTDVAFRGRHGSFWPTRDMGRALR